MIVKEQQVKNRFWSKVKKYDYDTVDCWIWEAATGIHGYGRFKVNGKLHSPHRMVYEWYYGEIPEGYDVCHHCDTSSCVNPDHLFAASRSKNMIDASVKGRLNPTKGEDHPNSKLRAVDIPRIRSLAENGRSQASIAKLYGVGKTTIREIVKRRRWKHID